eukprot:6368753-Pyramimonas_sp.AAC.1
MQYKWDAAVAGNSCLREVCRTISDEVAHELGIVHGASLVDIQGFYDSLLYHGIGKAATRFKLPPRILAMAPQMHTVARVFRQNGTYSAPQHARRSLLAGPGHSNNLARTVAHAVLEGLRTSSPTCTPWAWFDDISIKCVGTRSNIADRI